MLFNRKKNYSALIDKASKALAVESDIHEDDHIFNFLMGNPVFENDQGRINYYFNDGFKSAKQFDEIVAEHFFKESGNPTVLEFASGYGCVTRHLTKFPHFDLTSSDIHPQAIEFLQQNLKVSAFQSHVQPEKFPLDNQFDVVFALSFFSHMPITTWARWLVTLTKAVARDGLLVFTTQSEHSQKFFANAEFDREGYYFERTSEQGDLSLEEYGNTVVTAYFVQRVLSTIQQLELLEHRPGFWWDHQDLFILRKIEEL